MEQDVTDRFLLLLEENGYHTQQQIADMLGVSRPKAGTIKRKEQPPSLDDVLRLGTKHPEINLDWVLSGRGSKYVTGNNRPTKETFLPGGELSVLGAGKHAAGALEAILGKDFGKEDEAVPAKPLPTNRQEFINGLLGEIDVLKKDKHNLLTIQAEQQATIRHNQKMIDFLQGQVEQLQLQLSAKFEGNQYEEAPGTTTVAAEPITPIGFTRVRSMYDYTAMGVAVEVAA